MHDKKTDRLRKGKQMLTRTIAEKGNKPHCPHRLLLKGISRH